jgi:aspartate-semialdehyde dehydrogenase
LTKKFNDSGSYGGIMTDQYNIAVVGATGLVGRAMIKALEERDFPVKQLRLFASENSAGTKISFKGQEHHVETLSPESVQNIDYALFSAGQGTAAQWAPVFVEKGAVVIDNSACFREDDDVPLVVPEVNPDDIKNHEGIISNPNCVVIGLAMTLNRLHKSFKVKRVIITALQAVSGAGSKALDELNAQVESNLADKDKKGNIFPQGIANNLIPKIGDILTDGATEEEEKISRETVKILHDPTIGVTATSVRVPVVTGHSFCLNIETLYPSPALRVHQVLARAEGIDVFSDPAFPCPIDAAGTDRVMVGRIREDMTAAHAFNLWVVVDNLRKGAATNAVQILELLTAPEEKE